MFVKAASAGFASRGAYTARLCLCRSGQEAAHSQGPPATLQLQLPLASPLDRLRGGADGRPALSSSSLGHAHDGRASSSSLENRSAEGGGRGEGVRGGEGEGRSSSAVREERELESAVGESHDGEGKGGLSATGAGGRETRVGAFQQLPAVSPSYEILGSALKRARMVKPTKGITNVAKRERNRGAKQLDALTKELAGPLSNYVRKFPPRGHLHPFERSLLELTLGEGVYEHTLERVDAVRKRILDVGKSAAAQVNKSTTKREAEDRLAEGYSRVEELYQRNSAAVDALKEVAKTLRAMPVVRPRLPTLCLVGAPNVGKSSLVRVLSSGKPEVCNYPFTTRGISMGHFFVDGRRHQVTDTPGLLHRPEEKRNNIERLTLAALQHLPCAVLYVHDLTGDCGTSVEDQFHLYTTLKERFGSRPWLDAVSKADLLPPPPSALALESGARSPLESYSALGPAGALRVSNQSQEGVSELVARVQEMLASSLLGQHDENNDSEEDLHPAPVDPREERKRRQEEFYFPSLPPEMLRGV